MVQRMPKILMANLSSEYVAVAIYSVSLRNGCTCKAHFSNFFTSFSISAPSSLSSSHLFSMPSLSLLFFPLLPSTFFCLGFVFDGFALWAILRLLCGSSGKMAARYLFHFLCWVNISRSFVSRKCHKRCPLLSKVLVLQDGCCCGWILVYLRSCFV